MHENTRGNVYVEPDMHENTRGNIEPDIHENTRGNVEPDMTITYTDTRNRERAVNPFITYV